MPAEKCCPGTVVLTSPIKDDLIRRDEKCMNIKPQNLEVIYELEDAFMKFDYQQSEGGCSYPDSDDTITCHGWKWTETKIAQYAAVYFFYPCQQRKSFDLVYSIQFSSHNESRNCFQLNPDTSTCWKYYNYSMLPNIFHGGHKHSIETISMIIKRLTNRCHKHIEEIFCRMFLPECTSDGHQVPPCKSVIRELFIHACKHELSEIYFHSIQNDADMEFFVNYFSAKIHSEESCFNVSVTCDAPPHIPHSTTNIHTEIEKSYPVHTSITYTCDENYKLDGKATVFCKYSGEWDPLPKCILNSVDEKIQIIIASVLSFIILAVIISMVLIICYRQEIAIILYAKYGFRIKKLNEEQKEFDAFIAYSVEDIEFVKNELLARLENCAYPPFNICIHHRDFVIGDWIADNIIKAVTASRRTIIVLSQNFIDSQWCTFEFSQAHFRLIEDRSFKIIVIALTDPKDLENPPKLIKSYLKTGTYIARDKKLFWEKLFYQMPSGHKMTNPGKLFYYAHEDQLQEE